MSSQLVLLVICAQIVVFQFLYPALSRVALDYRIGWRNLPGELAAILDSYGRRARRLHRGIGLVLLTAAISFGFLLSLEEHTRKLGETAISLLSSAVLLAGFVMDRRRMAELEKRLPEPQLRSASLQARVLSQHYAPAWEALPVAVFVLTVTLTVWITAQPRFAAPAQSAERLLLWIPPLGQALYLVFTNLKTRRLVHGLSIPQRSRPFIGSPEEANDAAMALTRLQVRTLFLVKTLVVLMLGTIQLQHLWNRDGTGPGPGLAVWMLVVLLMGAFAGFIIRMTQLRRGIR